ncbi:MAG: DegT/DnrJ/EryC1/StrS family aminotransferase [Pirellulales bacterium]
MSTVAEVESKKRPAQKFMPTGAAIETNSQRSQLAVFGGPRAVTKRGWDRWRTSRLTDLLPIVPYLIRGTNTMVRGRLVEKFESRFAQLTGSRYGLVMNSGTAALHSAYMAVGIKPGDEVLVPTYTWFASATPILQCGGTPVFCDIDPRTLTLDPDDAERRLTSRTRAICVVHVWGNPAALDRLRRLADERNLALIEDASHAHGATYQGRAVGSWGDIGCFSLQGVKAVSGGEAGIAVTDNPLYLDRMMALGHNGRAADHVTDEVDVDQMNLGLKYRPHICAVAMATASLKRLPKLNKLRRKNYEILSQELEGCQAVRPIDTYPRAMRGGLLEFILRYDPEHAGGWPREAFVKACRAEGVPLSVDRYTQVGENARLLHEAAIFNEFDRSGFGGAFGAVRFEQLPRETSLPVAEKLSQELVSLPPLTQVRESYVRQCAQAMRKVAKLAPTIRDLRTGV